MIPRFLIPTLSFTMKFYKVISSIISIKEFLYIKISKKFIKILHLFYFLFKKKIKKITFFDSFELNFSLESFFY